MDGGAWWATVPGIAAAAAKLLQLCPTLCNPIDGSSSGPAVPGILQARTLQWVAISFSNAWKWKVKVKSLSHVRASATPWTAAHQAPPSMGFSRQEYWSGMPLPSLGIAESDTIERLTLTYPCLSVRGWFQNPLWISKSTDVQNAELTLHIISSIIQRAMVGVALYLLKAISV